ncbi:MAG: asparagine synthase (glutamine-hydrolyzing) [Chloroflexota bacterium]
MCGIAGIYNRDGRAPDRWVIERMARAIAHRGPDGERFHFDGGVALAHRHLRIIDLSDAALQPMTNEDGSVWLIFNGEVYNYVELRPQLEALGHVFASHSDSEVIIHAYEQWGSDCLRRFNGMFALAVWDAPKRSLFIARDRVGVKPLYYWWDSNSMVFASEIKALLQHPDIDVTPNLSAITEYMNAMHTTGEHTWFGSINRLLPGHFIEVKPDGLTMQSWWDLPSDEQPLGRHSEQYYVKNTRALLEDSVRLRLRSDVPLGSHLSGGVDSSAVVALLSKQLTSHGERLRTFSGAFAEGEAYDERPYIENVVSRYHTQHSETIPTAADVPALMEKIVWHMDEPAAGPGIFLQWAVCELTKRSGVIVVNGGQGGDEAWGGYFGYVPAYFKTLAAQARRQPKLYVKLARELVTLLSRKETRNSAMRAFLNGRRGRLQAGATVGDWAGDVFSGLQPAPPPAPASSNSTRNPLARAMYYDLKWYLPALLQVEDRISMAFGLESRAPLLDYRLLEHAATVPAALKLKGLVMKHVLKEAVKDLLPAAVYRRTDKKGMPTPIAPWFRGELYNWVEQQLSTASARTLFSRDYVETALKEHLSGKRDRSIDLWKMLNVAVWWRLFVERQAPELRDSSVVEPVAVSH